MKSKIKLSLIPKSKSIDAILTRIIETAFFEDYMVLIDNIDEEINLYPPEIDENVIRCNKENLENKIEISAENECTIIFINGFDITLDEIKEKYSKIVDKYDVDLYINNYVDIESDKNIIISIPDLNDVEKDDWEEFKESLNGSLDEMLKSNKNYDYNEDDCSELMSLLCENSCAQDLSSTNKEVVETYTYKNNEEDISVTVLKDHTVKIKSNGKELYIENKSFDFLANISKNIK